MLSSALKDGEPFDLLHYIEIEARVAYRLIVRTAWELVHLHGPKARVALSSPRTSWGGVAEQIAGRQEVYAPWGFRTVAETLYLRSDGVQKAGVATIRKKEHRKDSKSKVGLGAARHLVTGCAQIERTYLLCEISSEEVLAILPAEFGRWISPVAG